jgi:hypothetical protein
MDTDVRMAVAYIAFRLVSGSEAMTLRNRATGETFRFVGAVEDTSLTITDLSGSERINGTGGAGVWNLYHTGSRSRVHLELSGPDFKGLDLASGAQFSGSVTGQTVVVRDRAAGGDCTYELS